MTTASATAYDELRKRLRDRGTIGSIGTLLSWDQETMMPPKAAAFRAEQIAQVSRMAHERSTDPKLGELISACESDSAVAGDPEKAANVREARRDYDRATKLPTDLVVEMSETSSRAITAWKQARQDGDFGAFKPWLQKTVELNRRKAECYGVPEGGELYDALLEDYEPGMRAAQVETLFKPLRERLTPLISAIVDKGEPKDPTRGLRCPTEKQTAFISAVARGIGYDFGGGRLDPTTHPFCETMGPHDTRITTRYDEEHFLDALYTTLHEAGHGMYEQGLRTDEHFGEPLGEAVSLGIHESQSRMWENQVGRSRAFWAWALPVAREHFGAEVEGLSIDEMFRAANSVRPHFIRVESDEATYNLHIMLRFDIERLLLEGDLDVGDVPVWWNDRMKKDLGLDVTTDRLGCLQDVHWSMGAIGYFPTYTLGNLYCAQFWAKVNEDIPDLESRHEKGDFGALLHWLREKVHAPGRLHKAPALCERITGKPLSHEPLCDYLEAKLKPIYGL